MTMESVRNKRTPEVESKLRNLEQTLKRGEFESAVSEARAILREQPGLVAATRLLGVALCGCGRRGEGNAVLVALAARAPSNALVQNSLGAARRGIGDLEGALAAFKRACLLAPNFPPVWLNRASILFMQDRAEDGLRALDRAIALEPRNVAARMIRADLLREYGKIDDVVSDYRAVLELDPLAPWPWFGLSNLKNVPMLPSDIDQIRDALRAREECGDERTALQFALAKALEDYERYDEAFSALVQANAEVRQRVFWNAAKASKQIDAMLHAFPAVHASAHETQGTGLIFLVSLPRSGSTLVEQILASHRDVQGGGEQGYVGAVIAEGEKRRGCELAAWANRATHADWQRMGERYLQMTAPPPGRETHLTDKSLGNWRVIGPLLAMLPAARVVVCRRDPIESALSCYRQWFNQDPHSYAYDMNDIGAYWRDFDRACSHWSALYPDRIHTLVLEDLVGDQQRKTQELLHFCGLNFDMACMQFHTTERRIKTISAAQVREPLRRDTARAAKYGDQLDPLRAALGLPSFVATQN